jgi:hypothetical protein
MIPPTLSHFQTTLSRSPVITDLVVKDHTLMLTVASGGRSFPDGRPF